MGQGLFNDLLHDGFPKGHNLDAVGVLGRDNNGVDTERPAVFVVLKCHLGFAVGQDKRQKGAFPDFGQAPGQRVGIHYRCRHKLRRFAAGIAEYHALVAGAHRVKGVGAVSAVLQGAVNAHCDVRGLLVDSGQHRAGLIVKTVRGVGISDVPDRFPYYAGDIDITIGGHFSHDHYHAGGSHSLTCHPGPAVLLQNSVQNGIGYLIAYFVGMSFGHAFRGEQFVAHKIIFLP